VQLPTVRAIGMALVALVPLLALAGVFGERRTTETVDGRDITVRAAFPTRLTYEMLENIAISVHNRSARRIDTVTVRLDSSYTLRFSGVTFIPDVDEAYAVRLPDVMPGESRLVAVEIQGQRYGRHTGPLHIETTSGDSVSISLHTLVLP
jgi:hypothetical protein